MDFFPTKGIEYLLVLAYLALFLPFWALVVRRSSPARARATLTPDQAGSRFRVPEGLFFHRGHTWALPEGADVVRVGIDDFAQHLLGPLERVQLPGAGSALHQGERGFSVRLDGREIPLLSPVPGQVTAVNEEALAHPEFLTDDPYGRGWLLKVRTPKVKTALKNLLPCRLAHDWMEECFGRLTRSLNPEVGVALQDGGVPVSGLAREVAGDRWPELCAEFLLTDADADVGE